MAAEDAAREAKVRPAHMGHIVAIANEIQRVEASIPALHETVVGTPARMPSASFEWKVGTE